jgi:hypothetical protein
VWAGVVGAFAFFLVGAIDRVVEDLHGLVVDEDTRRVALTAMLPVRLAVLKTAAMCMALFAWRTTRIGEARGALDRAWRGLGYLVLATGIVFVFVRRRTVTPQIAIGAPAPGRRCIAGCLPRHRFGGRRTVADKRARPAMARRVSADSSYAATGSALCASRRGCTRPLTWRTAKPAAQTKNTTGAGTIDDPAQASLGQDARTWTHHAPRGTFSGPGPVPARGERSQGASSPWNDRVASFSGRIP